MTSGWWCGSHGYREAKNFVFPPKETRILGWYKLPVLSGPTHGLCLWPVLLGPQAGSIHIGIYGRTWHL